MSISSYRNHLFWCCLLFTFSICLWFFSGKATSQMTKSQAVTKAEKRIPVTTEQLQPDDGVIPVELKCEDAELSAPNAIEKLTCVIKNKTSKYITAGAIYTSITLEQQGKTVSSSSYDTFDTFLHPDFREDHPDNLVPPEGEYPLDDLPTTYRDGVTVKGIAVRIDYIEFADKTTFGPNRGGSRIITNTREGAAKYKNWLAQKYKQNKRSMNAIAFLLDKDQPLPEDIGIQNDEQEHGAIMYRNYARRTYQTKGAEGLTKHLKEMGTSATQ